MPVVAPAERTPAMERRASNVRFVNGRHLSEGYFTCGRAIEIVMTPSLLKPGSTARSFRKLASNSPAPISNTHARPTCATTSPRRIARECVPPLPVRVSSRRTVDNLICDRCATGTRPIKRPATTDVASANKMTTKLKWISDARGISSRPIAPSEPKTAAPNPSPPGRPRART